MKKLLNLGVTDELEDFRVSLVRNSNISAFILALLALFVTIVLSVYSPENIGFGFVFLVPPAVTFLLNFFNNTLFSRIIFILLTSFLISIVHAYFSGAGQPLIIWMFLFQFSSFLMLTVLFDTREQVAGGVSFGLMLLFVLSFPFFNAYLNIPEEIEIVRSQTTRSIFYTANVLLTTTILLYVQRKKINSEKEYKKVLQQLEEKDEALNKQERELQETFDEIKNTHREDDKRNWISEGINQLNNTLRNSNDANLFNKVLTQLIRYLKANQGALYEVKEDDFERKFFATRAFYGVDKNKSEKDKIYTDEEGILGDAYKEKAPVYRVEVPENYSIESGLGQNRPGSLYVVPMIYESNIEGMLELAAFKKLEDHEKEYIRKVSDILARFIESYQVNIQSKELLEKTNQQTEEMRAQEEEMRQNMEELQATQEELHRKEREYITKINELENKLKTLY